MTKNWTCLSPLVLVLAFLVLLVEFAPGIGEALRLLLVEFFTLDLVGIGGCALAFSTLLCLPLASGHGPA